MGSRWSQYGDVLLRAARSAGCDFHFPHHWLGVSHPCCCCRYSIHIHTHRPHLAMDLDASMFCQCIFHKVILFLRTKKDSVLMMAA